MCGDCCKTLRPRVGAPDWPAGFSKLARIGYYGLPTEGGLQTWAWERRAMLRSASERGLELRFEPSLVVADERSGRLVTLVYELGHMACPFLVPGPMPLTEVCGAYEARPLVCRAFPVLSIGGQVLPSSKCPAGVEPRAAERDAFIETFGGAFLAAEGSSILTREVAALLRTMEERGVLRLARDLSKEQVLARLQREAPLDLWDLACAAPEVDEHAFWMRLNPTDGPMLTPAP